MFQFKILKCGLSILSFNHLKFHSLKIFQIFSARYDLRAEKSRLVPQIQ